MNKKFYAAVLLLFLLFLSPVQASTEKVIQAYIPVTDIGKTEPELIEVRYLTWNSLPEAYAESTFWPYYYNSPHEEAFPKANVNLASASNIQLASADFYPSENESPSVKIDVSKMTLENVPDFLTKESLLKVALDALEKNLMLGAVYNCKLEVLGLENHPELQKIRLPEILNKT